MDAIAQNVTVANVKRKIKMYKKDITNEKITSCTANSISCTSAAATFISTSRRII